MKIKNIEISGLRGVKDQLSLPLEGKSMLIYGENGSGKSSITDGLEWFYADEVKHLSTGEIGRGGIAALRNIFLPEDKEASVDIKFSDNKYDSKKRLYLKRGVLLGEHSNSGEEFGQYLAASNIKNLILRYQALLEFILCAKNDKLREISLIIGFEEVTKTRDVLKKAVGDLKKEIKLRDYDSQINAKQSVILEQVSRNINDDVQYLEAISELVVPLKLQADVRDMESVDKILERIKLPENEETLKLQLSCEKALEFILVFAARRQTASEIYARFFEKYQAVFSDKSKLKNIALERLLAEGLSLLKRDDFNEDVCPLCRQEKNRKDLISGLKARIQALTAYKKEKQELDELKQEIVSIHEAIGLLCENVLREPLWGKKENAEPKLFIESLRNLNSESLQAMKTAEASPIPPAKYFPLDAEGLAKLRSELLELKQETYAVKKDDLKFLINNKLLLTKTAYLEIRTLKKERDILSRQLASMELMYSAFVSKQSAGLAAFLTAISKDINDFYGYMNTSEGVDEIQLIPIESDGELLGLTLQFKFHGNLVSPPDKYLSESHLNCLGICLFLASAKVFSKGNRYFVLDDVVSSFDANHRLRFVNLLLEKFSNYQILVFTHNTSWFGYFANAIKGKNWFVNKIRWTPEGGACLEAPPLMDLKAKIEAKFSGSDPEGLGNLTRKYLEQLLKDICFNLQVELRFLYNSENENRMSYELLTGLKAVLKRKKSDLLDNSVFESLFNSSFVGNKESHDSDFNATIPDLRTFYADVQKLEVAFRCAHCGRLISGRNYTLADKKISCGCPVGKKYSWE
ncbi:MAG: hypothetical protein A2X34_02985 [Elusimicrobia bacterium GWC2_51_8]|nr:MAG: hypothetical protein A2X33_07575 [Elusimicrobia bacterium GWA2_51_34]OGR59584.1 MAG: hypothetical protein A2X34_02985 [Elusimicrobia bacterium GWC2_51_8]OGR85801.1 MAG: hypothetical protein A2021_00245 [Elusimicrobia bacterium GWF2_52_66]